MNDKELQKEFILFLAKLTGAKTQEELEMIVSKLGEKGMKKAYEQFLQEKQKMVKAAHGAKLQYINFLNGRCPDGSMPKFFKSGGKMKKGCGCEDESPVQTMKHGRGTKAVQEFRASRMK